jgi:hypothetical protein
MDLFVVPTIGFDLLYAFIIIRLDRRDLVWINVTTNPTAEWIARQLTEAFPWHEAPRYLIRDRDRIYGEVARQRIRAMGIRDKPNRTSVTLAERFCRTADWVDPARVRRPYRCLGRGAPAPDPANLCRLLQQDPNTPVVGQRCTGVSSRSAGREHRVTRDSRWASSPLRPGLGFRYTQPASADDSTNARKKFVNFSVIVPDPM